MVRSPRQALRRLAENLKLVIRGRYVFREHSERRAPLHRVWDRDRPRAARTRGRHRAGRLPKKRPVAVLRAGFLLWAWPRRLPHHGTPGTHASPRNQRRLPPTLLSGLVPMEGPGISVPEALRAAVWRKERPGLLIRTLFF